MKILLNVYLYTAAGKLYTRPPWLFACSLHRCGLVGGVQEATYDISRQSIDQSIRTPCSLVRLHACMQVLQIICKFRSELSISIMGLYYYI